MVSQELPTLTAQGLVKKVNAWLFLFIRNNQTGAKRQVDFQGKKIGHPQIYEIKVLFMKLLCELEAQEKKMQEKYLVHWHLRNAW